MNLLRSICTFALASPLAFAVSSVSAQQVEPSIHKLCVEAKDYAGCVRSMRGDTVSPSRQIQSQGADLVEGNQCPAGFAYVGGGNCMEVKCVYNMATGLGFDTGHDQRVAGKADWGCKSSFWYGAGVMQLQGNARTSNNLNCPPGEPKIGFNSTCQTVSADWESPLARAEREKREGPKCDFKIQPYNCSFNSYLQANPAIKTWADLNPEMAQKERVRLRSVD